MGKDYLAMKWRMVKMYGLNGQKYLSGAIVVTNEIDKKDDNVVCSVNNSMDGHQAVEIAESIVILHNEQLAK